MGTFLPSSHYPKLCQPQSMSLKLLPLPFTHNKPLILLCKSLSISGPLLHCRRYLRNQNQVRLSAILLSCQLFRKPIESRSRVNLYLLLLSTLPLLLELQLPSFNATLLASGRFFQRFSRQVQFSELPYQPGPHWQTGGALSTPSQCQFRTLGLLLLSLKRLASAVLFKFSLILRLLHLPLKSISLPVCHPGLHKDHPLRLLRPRLACFFPDLQSTTLKSVLGAYTVARSCNAPMDTLMELILATFTLGTTTC